MQNGALDARDRPKKEKSRGQNTNRDYGYSKDEVGLCQSRAHSPEFSPLECKFGPSCRFEHDLRKYLKDWKREDLTTLNGVCPIWKAKGKCIAGWKCRFVGSHMKERDTENGGKELVLVERLQEQPAGVDEDDMGENGILNVVSTQAKTALLKRKFPTPKADEYINWLENSIQSNEHIPLKTSDSDPPQHLSTPNDDLVATGQENRARYIEPPFLPSEKRRIYFGPETPILAPLTTQGNLPFRRLCVSLGAQITYSEMAMSLPLIQGQKSEWALLKAHESEAESPQYKPADSALAGLSPRKDLRFGAQIAANKPWQALKATEILTQLCPHLRVIDLNCGCPIDLIYRQGAGSALLDSPAKLEKMIRGMNAVSQDIPITVKIRMGTRDHKPTAHRLIERLVYGDQKNDGTEGSCSGAAAITLHGRSRQQRYTRNADWEYIAHCSAIVQRYKERGDALSDTIRESDSRRRPPNDKVYFIGNGDCYSHVDYNTSLAESKVDAVMIARGALIKPWIFEEIQQGQYIDKSATERLAMVEQFVRNGLETWGSDEVGVGVTRRFLLEWLSFAYRYIPVGILEHLPPSLQDRPPAWKGRNELETLLGSDNYKDWIKIRYVNLLLVTLSVSFHLTIASDMFLGPAHKNFKFEPKHKSNSYEIEAEG